MRRHVFVSTLIGFFLGASVWGGRSLAGETQEKKVLGLSERQDKARKELNKLLQRMREISERLKKRGDVHQAEKLEEAFGKIQEVGLLADMRKVVDTLKRARMWEAVDQQEDVLKKIEKILDILLDRKSYEELDKNAKELDKIQKSIKNLIEEEEKHIDTLKKITEEGEAAISEDVREAARAIDDLMARQRALMQRTKAADMGENLRAVDRALSDLDKLISSQKDLLDRVKGIEGLTKAEARLLEDALGKLEDLVERQDRASRAAALEGRTPGLDAMARTLDRIRKDQEALGASNRAETRKAGKEGLHQARIDLQDLMERQRAVKELTRAAGVLESIRKAQAEMASRVGKDPEWAKEQARAQGAASKQAKLASKSLLRAMDDSALTLDQRDTLQEASEAADKAAKELREASKAAEKGGAEAARTAGQALETLDKAEELLNGVLGKGWKNLRKTQEGLARETERLAGKVGLSPAQAVEVEPEARQMRGEAAEAVRKASKKMRKAGEEIENRKSGEATGRQSEALGELLKASRLIQKVLDKATEGTTALADRQGNLGKEAQDLAEKIAKASRDKPQGEKGKVGSALKRAASKASEAADRQVEAAGNLAQGRNQEGGERQEKAREALEASAKGLADAIEKASGTKGREDIAQSEAKTAKETEKVAKDIAKAGQSLAKRGAQSRGAKMGDVAKALQKAAQAAVAAGKAAKAGKSSKASEQAKAANEGLKKARDDLAEFLKTSRPDTRAEAKAQAGLRDMAKRVADSISSIGRNQPSAPGRREAIESAEKTREAGRKMSEAARQLDEGNPREAQKKEERALEDLRAARKKAEELKKRLLEKSEPRREEVAGQQRRLKEQADKLAEKLDRMDRKAPGGQSSAGSGKKAGSSMRKAGKHMEKGAENLVNRNFPKTKREQREAIKAMEEARREVKKLEDEAIRRAKERELNALVREQAGTEEKTKLTEKELEKLRRLMEARDMGRASRAMNQANHKVSKMDLVPGKEKMEEARDFLKKAEDAVKEQQRRYQQLAQEQLIFQIKTLLREIVPEQRKINGLMEKMGARVEGGRRLARGDVRELLRASDSEEALAVRMSEIGKKIEKEAPVFTWVFRSTTEDMRSIRDLLRDRPPDVGPYARGLGKEIVSRLQELLDAFKLELKRRQKKPGGGQKKGGGRPRLVPPLAELQMLRRLQSQVKDNTESMIRNLKTGKELTPVQELILERLVHRQGNMNDVMERFIKSLTREGDKGSRR